MKSAHEVAQRSYDAFGGNELGPVHVEIGDESTVAATPGGPTIELIVPFPVAQEDAKRLVADGLAIHTDGQVTGRLIQPQHGTRAMDRVLRLEGTTPNRYPAGAYFRSRSLAGVLSLETDDGWIITPGRPAVLTAGRTVRTSQQASVELLTLYAAVKACLRVTVVS
ncbi:hypothetical protein [Ilumatobacter nonamiensis]|uniref:hypothetical protein n=1 Tax=Ilumatobacter nonamiensis TaxID=467093 RepID=UPI000345494C|nr:hypothetical protein [Ilumatobacter nonamiensis]